ncbi:hypothetical protein SAMN05421544_11853 [Riemerella columbipharyngis]|uniref:Uncharacterized protein n=1 Tax=Riemerella columbipharyngis TaxID=1071918 RepID=A0A1G7F103_9FLAO|nr:hypothetical protein SAMN05421544_11853 [Riemerella columbipharyngis]
MKFDFELKISFRRMKKGFKFVTKLKARIKQRLLNLLF